MIMVNSQTFSTLLQILKALTGHILYNLLQDTIKVIDSGSEEEHSEDEFHKERSVRSSQVRSFVQ